MRVGYFGPEGTFTQEALIASVGEADLELVPLATIYDTVMAVHDGTVDRGRCDRRRGRAPDPPVLDRADRASAFGDRGRSLPSPRQCSVRTLHPLTPSRCAGARR